MAKLEIALLAGSETKEFLASLTKQIDRLEKLVGDNPETAKSTYNDGDDKGAAPKKSVKKVAVTEDYDDEETETVDEETEDAFDAPPKKAKTKTAKLTAQDVNAACQAHAKIHGFKTTKGLLKKKFKVESTQELAPEDYATVIDFMKSETED